MHQTVDLPHAEVNAANVSELRIVAAISTSTSWLDAITSRSVETSDGIMETSNVYCGRNDVSREYCLCCAQGRTANY